MGTGNVYPDEVDVLVRPRLDGVSKRGVLYLHGREVTGDGGGLEWQKFTERSTLIHGIANAGHTVLSCDLGGNTTWGSDTVVARVSAAEARLLTLDIQPTKIVLIGQSMGALSALVWAAHHRRSVACIVGMLPVVDLADMVTGDRDRLATEINDAYGGEYVENEHGPAHNPTTMAKASAFAGLPIQLWYGSVDATVVPDTVTAFQSAVGPSCVALRIPGGHTESTLAGVRLTAVLRFIAASA